MGSSISLGAPTRRARRQRLGEFGNQREEPVNWSPETVLEPVPNARVTVALEGRDVHVRAWRYVVHGVSGATVPVYLLDTAVPQNAP